MQKLSTYAEQLPIEALDKIDTIGGIDPFEGPLGECTDEVPPVEASDLVSYLVLQTSFITAKQFKAHKSLESYNQFVCGLDKRWKSLEKRRKISDNGSCKYN